VIRTLTHDDFESLFAAFTAAFSDYVVKLSPTREQLLEMFTRRGWRPELSVAAFEDDAIVAFTVNGVDGDAGYDSGTGVLPTHRRHGLGLALMEQSFDLLRATNRKRTATRRKTRVSRPRGATSRRAGRTRTPRSPAHATRTRCSATPTVTRFSSPRTAISPSSPSAPRRGAAASECACSRERRRSPASRCAS
jgi:GNAT superfamily N-acetyltransferase